MTSDPYTPEELESLLPPFPIGEPILEIDVGVSGTPHHRAYIDTHGTVDTEAFGEQSEIESKSFKAIVGSNIRRIREERQETNESWSAAATNRMLHGLTSGALFTDPKVVNDIENGDRHVKAEELVWFSILFEVPVWELLVPPSDEYVNLNGYIRDRTGLLLTLTHMDPAAIDELDRSKYLLVRRAQRDLERAGLTEAMEKLRDEQFEETFSPYSATALVVREMKVLEPQAVLDSDERRPGESAEDHGIRQNRERGRPVSSYETLQKVREDLDQARVGLEEVFRETQRELDSRTVKKTKED